MKQGRLDSGNRFVSKRSNEFMAGYLALVESVISNKPFSYPYPAGSVQADAFISGMSYAQRVLARAGR